jgi:predicted RNA-binding Zn-ribbon protein involved in translation (DUF1610 family)
MGVRTKLAGLLRTDNRERPYECLSCGLELDLVYHTCPRCGSFRVDRRPECFDEQGRFLSSVPARAANPSPDQAGYKRSNSD